jgi:hypothetical protein
VTLRAAWRRGQQGWPKDSPLAQFPNVPLIVALVAGGVAGATQGSVHDAAAVVALVGWAVWASDEVARGANLFRRALGVAGLVYVVVRIV